MNKQSIIKKLARINGIKQEYFNAEGKLEQVSYEECSAFLKMLGLKINTVAELTEELATSDLEYWKRKISPVKVSRNYEFPVIQVRIPTNELNSKFKWILTEENGTVHQDEFSTWDLTISGYKEIKTASYYQFDLPLPINPPPGYHTLKVIDEHNKEYMMNLIITPEKCYQNENIKKADKLWGPKLKLHTMTTNTGHNIADSGDLKYIIKKVAAEQGAIVGISAVNQVLVNSEKLNPYIPSSKILFNTIYIDIDRAITFIRDKSVELRVIANKFQEYISKLDQSEPINFIEVNNKKFEVYREIYQSFRENHLNTHTDLASKFYEYLSRRGDRFYKLALFRALEDMLINEDPSLESWHLWPEQYKNPQSEVVKNFENNNSESIQFYQFIQWQADLQLKEAGDLSYNKGLKVGILVDIPYAIDYNSADTWVNQPYFSFNALIESNENIKNIDEENYTTPPLIQNALEKGGYSYLIENFRANMIHSGAVKIENLAGYDSTVWRSIGSDKECKFHVKYCFEDIIGIIALESVRNKCIVLSDDTKTMPPRVKQAVLQYGIYNESDFDLKEIDTEKDLIKLFNKQTSEKERYVSNYQIAKIPRATYRMQLNDDFTFQDAKDTIPYLKKLGISHCYISPVLHARLNSTHGYDIINHNEFHPSIGSKQDFYEFADCLHSNGMGLICDIVPNHMGINSENKWWMDVLENGQSSRYANYFDIDWDPIKKELKGKVLVPILGDHYGNVLNNGELKLSFSRESGKISINYWEHFFPINPSSYSTILEHRIDILESRIGSNNEDLFEFQSIITELNNLPKHTETEPKWIKHRNREKHIGLNRLSTLATKNIQIAEFIEENLQDFETKQNDPLAINRLHNLLNEQAYRLAYWRVSADEINYRRFFDVNDLAGVRVENPEVFANTHNFIMELIEQKKIDGLRLDHPDGLLDPTGYLKKLQKEAARRLNIAFNENEEQLLSSDNLPIYVLSEKITAPFETLPENWAIHGTVGYEFLNKSNELFVNTNNKNKFSKLYNRFISKNIDYNEMVIECKKLIMMSSLTGELNVLSSFLNRISERNYSTRDYTLNSLRNALIEVIAHFPVYRTYISNDDPFPKGKDYIKWAVRSAKKNSYSMERSIFDFIEKILLNEYEEDKESELYNQILKFTMKFQQYTGPLMAKGLEDTTFYRFNRLISLNEVGGEPECFGTNIDEFHVFNQNAANILPYNMLASTTHDTKRSEDTRARISVLSEVPDVWQKKINRFSQLNRLKKTKVEDKLLPDKNDEYLFYQTLIGIWPQYVPSEEELNSLISRVEEYMIKAIREAKIHTSWVNINNEYEDALKIFIKKVLSNNEKHPFWRAFRPFLDEIAIRGNINSLSQTVLKLTCPGVPDIYQGTEVRSLHLVDPDNRRPVDYDRLSSLCNEIDSITNNKDITIDELTKLITNTEIDKIKLFLLYKLLNFRAKNEELYKHGEYIPVKTSGQKEAHIVAFARRYQNKITITIIPRLVYDLIDTDNKILLNKDIWEDTHLIIPDELSGYKWKSIIDNSGIEIYDNKLYINQSLKVLPVDILESKL